MQPKRGPAPVSGGSGQDPSGVRGIARPAQARSARKDGETRRTRPNGAFRSCWLGVRPPLFYTKAVVSPPGLADDLHAQGMDAAWPKPPASGFGSRQPDPQGCADLANLVFAGQASYEY